jgi:hypothetical protein
VAAARACVDICQARQAPAFELFFGQAVLALGLRATGNSAGYDEARAAALAAYTEVVADEQPWCRRELGELVASTAT